MYFVGCILCLDGLDAFHITDEGVYMDSSGGQVKDVRLQWGEIPSSIGQLCMVSEHVCYVTFVGCPPCRIYSTNKKILTRLKFQKKKGLGLEKILLSQHCQLKLPFLCVRSLWA